MSIKKETKKFATFRERGPFGQNNQLEDINMDNQFY